MAATWVASLWSSRLLASARTPQCSATTFTALPPSMRPALALPFAADRRPFSLTVDGRLAGTAACSVADGSGFRYLPAKGSTLSLMANARLVATEAMRRG